MRATRQVNAPDAVRGLTHHAANRVTLTLKVIRPQGQRAGIVAAQTFHIKRFEPGALHVLERFADMGQFTIRKHVFFNETGRPQGAFPAVRIGRGNAVVQHQPAVLEQGADFGEIRRQMKESDVLEHAHRGDLVKQSIALVNIAVVL